MSLPHLNYPLQFLFKITTLANDFSITDRNGNSVAYVRSKLFRLKEDVVVYDSSQKTRELYHIKADRWLDFNVVFTITDAQTGAVLGKMARKGMRSFWKATYTIMDGAGNTVFTLQEDNPWTKFMDAALGEIPVLGMLTGYLFNPSYSAVNQEGKSYFQLKKMPSFFGRKFELNRTVDIDDDKESLVVLSLFMMVLLERQKG